MLKTAAKAGIRPAEFWEMTPGELVICIEGYIAINTESLKEAITVAYMGAAWQRSKKMPRLETVLSKIDGTTRKKTKKKQTPEEMLEVAKAITDNLNKAR